MGEVEEDEPIRLNWDPVAEFVKAAEVRYTCGSLVFLTVS